MSVNVLEECCMKIKGEREGCMPFDAVYRIYPGEAKGGGVDKMQRGAGRGRGVLITWWSPHQMVSKHKV